MTLLENRTAVVTGGSSGIGRAISLAYADEGADVVIADLRAEPREGGEPTHDRIAAETDRSASFVDCDVTDRSDLAAAVDAADEFGGLDVMVNNAGYFRGEDFLEVDPDEFYQTMDVNVFGTFFGAQAAARKMVDQDDGGVILNLSSTSGIEGARNYVSYCASKGAVRLMSYALAAELGREGIRVNAIHPGIVETTMTQEDVPIVGTDAGEAYKREIPSGRYAQPEDIADAAVFLASDMGEYVNGSSLVLDGGLTNTT